MNSSDKYVNRDIHDKEIEKYRNMLQTLGVKYQTMGKKYTLEQRVTSEQKEQIQQLISIIKKLESKQEPKIIIDNSVTDTSELEQLWMKEFNISPQEVSEYIAQKTGNTNNFLSKYI